MSAPAAACTISAVRNEPGHLDLDHHVAGRRRPPSRRCEVIRAGRTERGLGEPARHRAGVPVPGAAVAHAPGRRRHRAVAALLEDAQQPEPVDRAVVGGDDEVAPGHADDDRLRIGRDQRPAQLVGRRRRANRVVGLREVRQRRGQQDPPPDRRVGDPAVR